MKSPSPAPCPPAFPTEDHGNNGLLQLITYVNEAAPPSTYRNHETRAPRYPHHHRYNVSTRTVTHPRKGYRRAGHHQTPTPSQTAAPPTGENAAVPNRHLRNHSASDPTAPG